MRPLDNSLTYLATLLVYQLLFAPLATAKTKEQGAFVVPQIVPTISGRQNEAILEVKADDKGGSKKLVVKARAGADGELYFKKSPRLVCCGRLQKKTLDDPDSYFSDVIYTGSNGLELWFDDFEDAEWWTGNLDWDDSEYTIVGRLRLLGFQFDSVPGEPLTFRLVKGKGLVYLSGRGTVVGLDGTVTKLGMTAPAMKRQRAR